MKIDLKQRQWSQVLALSIEPTANANYKYCMEKKLENLNMLVLEVRLFYYAMRSNLFNLSHKPKEHSNKSLRIGQQRMEA